MFHVWNRGLRRRRDAQRRGAPRGPRAASSTAATTPPASPSSTPREPSDTRKRAGKLQPAHRRPRRRPARRRRHRHRPHPLGDARRPDRRQRAPAPRRRRQARPDPQRHHRELRRAQARSSLAERRDTVFTSETDTEVAALLRRPRLPTTTGDLTEALRRGRRRGSTAPSPCSRCTQDQPGVVVGARRNSPLVDRPRRRARTSSAPTSPRSSSTPATRLAIGQDQIVTITARRRHGHRLRRQPRSRAKQFDVDWDAAAAEKGGWSTLHGQGDQRAAATPSPTPCSAASTDGAVSSTSCGSRRACCGASTGSSSSAAAPPPTPGMVAKYAIEHWTRIPVRGRARARVPLPRPGPRRAARSSSRSASPARPWTR